MKRSFEWQRIVLAAAVAVITATGATAQTTISGTVSNDAGTAAIAYPTVSYWLNDKTNWPWTAQQSQGTVAGGYTATFTPSPTNAHVTALAVGYQRASVKLDLPNPVLATNHHFNLSSGTMRIEVETDSLTTMHVREPTIVVDETASNGRRLRLDHYFTDMRTPVYFPRAAEYDFTVRYRTASGVQLWMGINEPRIPLREWNHSASAWTTGTRTYLIDAPGWKNIDLRGQGMPRGGTVDTVDYLEIVEAAPMLFATVTGVVSSAGNEIANARVVLVRDDCTNWPGSVSGVNGTTAGAYSMTNSAVRRADLVVHAIGYERQVQTLEPLVATGIATNVPFSLTPGVMRIECETDPVITYVAHSAFRPTVRDAATASGARYLKLEHNVSHLRNQIHFPVAGIYYATLRYNVVSAMPQLQIAGTCVTYFPATSAAWQTRTYSILVPLPGWREVNLYLSGISSPSNDGVDYLDIDLPSPVTISGKVTVGGQPLANTRVGAYPDTPIQPGSCTLYTDTDASGNYSITLAAREQITIFALAIDCDRQAKVVSPTTQTVNFALAYGRLRVEPEYDASVTFQQHSAASAAHVPKVASAAGCSLGTYLFYPHHNCTPRTRLYFPAPGKYEFRMRYQAKPTSAYFQFRLNDTTQATFYGTGNVWTTVRHPFTITTAGWRNVDIYGYGLDGNGEGVDYFEIFPVRPGTAILVR